MSAVWLKCEVSIRIQPQPCCCLGNHVLQIMCHFNSCRKLNILFLRKHYDKFFFFRLQRSCWSVATITAGADGAWRLHITQTEALVMNSAAQVPKINLLRVQLKMWNVSPSTLKMNHYGIHSVRFLQDIFNVLFLLYALACWHKDSNQETGISCTSEDISVVLFRNVVTKTGEKLMGDSSTLLRPW